MPETMYYKDLDLVNTREMFKAAMEGGYAIPAYNFNNMEQLQGIIIGCVESRSPVILQVSGSARKYANQTFLPFMAMGAVRMAKDLGADIPIALHLDHGDSFVVPEAHFTHPEIKDIYHKSFDVTVRDRLVSERIHKMVRVLKDHLYEFIDKFEIDMLIPQNALTIPLNIPLGIAITQVIMETGIPTVAHHHDFYWERDRFMTNAVWDYLHMAFPPNLPTIDHVVINSFANEQLSLRKGISATFIPNIMDFENPPPPVDDYASDVRAALGIDEDELFVLQPTRVVARKGIEMAIELVHRRGMKAKLVISHASGDEGYDYEQRLREYSKIMDVDTIFVSDIINEKRGTTKDGRKIYTLDDIYPHSNLVTYPSTFEGFGNAFLEAVYFRKPIVVNEYSIYNKDIKPKGFDVIELPGYVTQEAVQKTKEFFRDSKRIEAAVEQNYEIGRRFFSFEVLDRQLKHYIAEHIALRG